jgi:hypothetical protein
MLSLMCVVVLCEVSDAGVICDANPFEFEAVEFVGAGPVETPSRDDPTQPTVRSRGQQSGMTASPLSFNDVQPTVSIAFWVVRSDQPIVVQWLAIESRILIPSPIPICLLKVPIVAA